MGGRGSGGRRIGAGRKPNDPFLRSIQGGRARGSAPAAAKAPSESPVETFMPPLGLFMMRGDEPGQFVPNVAALAVWKELAPGAFEARTLTRRTAAAFAMLCRAVAVERSTEMPDADHRGLMQRIGTWMKDFGLAPLGKAVHEAPKEPKANPLDRFTTPRGAQA